MLLAVINKDSLMCRHLCDKLYGRSYCSHIQQSSIDSQLFVQNHDLFLPHLHSMLGGPRLNIAMTFVEKN